MIKNSFKINNERLLATSLFLLLWILLKSLSSYLKQEKCAKDFLTIFFFGRTKIGLQHKSNKIEEFLFLSKCLEWNQGYFEINQKCFTVIELFSGKIFCKWKNSFFVNCTPHYFFHPIEKENHIQNLSFWAKNRYHRL